MPMFICSEAIPIPLLSRREQRAIVARLEALRGTLNELQRLPREVEAELASFRLRCWPKPSGANCNMKLTPIFDEAIKESKALLALHDSAAATGALPAGISPEVFLRAALVFALAAIDKILHEAISKHFTSLAREEILDRFVKFKVSKAYEIALAARSRAGVATTPSEGWKSTSSSPFWKNVTRSSKPGKR